MSARVRSRARPALVGALAALVLLGCASPTAPLTARRPLQRPELSGRSLALLPPLAFSGESGPAAAWDEATRLIWKDGLAGIRVVPPEQVRAALAADAAGFAAARTRILRELPVDAAPQTERRTLMDEKQLEGTDLGGRIWVTLRDSTGGLGAGPPSLPAEWLARFDADYVLFSVSFRGYAQHTRIAALLGFLPIFGTSRVEGQRPRGNLLLYEAASGQLVWSAFVGGELDADLDPRLPDGVWPALATAHLLTGAIHEPVLRLLRASPRDD